jgi:hypothetical protein
MNEGPPASVLTSLAEGQERLMGAVVGVAVGGGDGVGVGIAVPVAVAAELGVPVGVCPVEVPHATSSRAAAPADAT